MSWVGAYLCFLFQLQEREINDKWGGGGGGGSIYVKCDATYSGSCDHS